MHPINYRNIMAKDSIKINQLPGGLTSLTPTDVKVVNLKTPSTLQNIIEDIMPLICFSKKNISKFNA